MLSLLANVRGNLATRGRCITRLSRSPVLVVLDRVRDQSVPDRVLLTLVPQNHLPTGINARDFSQQSQTRFNVAIVLVQFPTQFQTKPLGCWMEGTMLDLLANPVVLPNTQQRHGLRRPTWTFSKS